MACKYIPLPLLDLKPQYLALKAELDQALNRVCSEQRFILGPEVEAFEAEIARFIGCRFALGVSSGTDALLVALMALGIGPGDEVITTPYSFFATAGSIARVGAVPVFVDIEPRTFNIDVLRITEKITPRTKAIMPVHLFGQCADMKPLMEIAAAHGLAVIEDACQALSAEYHGKGAGNLGTIGCFSFFPSKNLGAFGDGGLVTTNDQALFDKLRALRVHGGVRTYYHELVGGNFRLDALQAAVLRVKLPHLDLWSTSRAENAAQYKRLFAHEDMVADAEPGDGQVVLPKAEADCRHIYNQFVIRVTKRNELLQFLKDQNIGANIYYPLPLHLQECFCHLGFERGSLPQSELAAEESLALPIYPELSSEQISSVVSAIKDFYA